MGITKATAPLLEAFPLSARLEGERAGMFGRREASLRHFAEIGYPTRKQEIWRFTDLRPITSAPILPLPVGRHSVTEAFLQPFLLGVPSHRLVLVNGRFSPELSRIGVLPTGVWLGSTAEVLKTRPDLVEAAFHDSELVGAESFASLNAALYADGFILAVDPGIELEMPVEIIHIAQTERSGAIHVRNAVKAGADSRATLIESHVGSGAAWSNLVTTVAVDAGAVLRHVKIQREAADALHTSLIRAVLDRQARYESFTLTLGALLSRQDIQVVLAGEGAALALNGAYLLRGDQESTFVPFVDHQAPGCQTDELVKGVMQDRAHGVFLGAITVRPGADQTNANQLNRNLLLSPTATVDTKPELEIFADEVKCSHGATVGSLDETAMFYLQARGIDEATARHMLLEAYAADAIDASGLDRAAATLLRGYVQAWLEPSEAGA